MSQKSLNDYFKQVQSEQIDFERIDQKRKQVMFSSYKLYISPKISYMTALALLFSVTVLGIMRINQMQDQAIAQAQENVFDYNFMHQAYVSTFSGIGE